MDDSELASILAAHEARAVGYFTSEIADEQARAIDYYYGRMPDLELRDGCSTVAGQGADAVYGVRQPGAVEPVRTVCHGSPSISSETASIPPPRSSLDTTSAARPCWSPR